MSDGRFAVFGGWPLDGSGTASSSCEALTLDASGARWDVLSPMHEPMNGMGSHVWQSAGASLSQVVRTRIWPKCTRKGWGGGGGFRAACRWYDWWCVGYNAHVPVWGSWKRCVPVEKET